MFHSLIPISGQDRISPYNIKKTSDENKETINLGIQVIDWSNINLAEQLNYFWNKIELEWMRKLNSTFLKDSN